jgi:hypothetical protein
MIVIEDYNPAWPTEFERLRSSGRNTQAGRLE